MVKAQLHPFLFALLAAWKSTGHPVGVDTHLKALELLGKLPADTPPERLKSLLAPLLTRDKDEQKAFYEQFELVLANLPAAATPPVGKPKKWLWYVLPAVFLLLCLSGVKIYLKWGIDISTTMEVRTETIRVGQTASDFCLDSAEAARYQLARIVYLEHTNITNQGSSCLHLEAASVGVDSVVVNYLPRSSTQLGKKVLWVIQVLPAAPQNTASNQSDADTLYAKAYTHAPGIRSLQLRDGPPFSWRKNNVASATLHKTIWLLGFLVSLLLIGLFRNLLLYKKNDAGPTPDQDAGIDRTELSKPPNEHPPYIWPLQVPGVDRIAFEESVGVLIQQLRRRSEVDIRVFDVPRSIRETTQKARVTFLYRNPTQPDEYLLLIDVRARNDHRAQLFDLLYREFVRQEVLIERFFYDGDLRLCWNEKYRNGLSLRELQHKFAEHHLMVVGNGESLINPLTGRLERWTELFSHWQPRSLLSTRPIVQWGHREVELDALFRVAPANLNGLSWLATTDAAPDDRDIDYWKHQPDAVIQPLRISEKLPESVIFDTLEAEFLEFRNRQRDERLLQWLAACAVSPVMHWDATLFFGQLVDNNPQFPLVTIQNLQRLNRLTWFNEGVMPEKARRVLLDWLRDQYPALLLRIRRAWKQLLENNLVALQTQSMVQNQPPFEQSVAYEDLRLHLVVNELAIDKLQQNALPPAQRRPLEKELAALSQTQTADFVALALLEEAKAREEALQSAVPEAPPEPEPLPRLLSGWRWQLPLFLLGALAVWLYNPDRSAVCENTSKDGIYQGAVFQAGAFDGSNATYTDEIPFLPGQLAGGFTYKDTAYCLGTPQQQLLFYEYLVCEMLDSLAGPLQWTLQQSNRNQSGVFAGHIIPPAALRFIRENRLDSVSFYQNIGAAYWNAALRYRTLNRDVACVYFNALDRWPWRDSILSPSEVAWIGTLCYGDFQGSTSGAIAPITKDAPKDTPKDASKAQKRAPAPKKNNTPNLKKDIPSRKEPLDKSESGNSTQAIPVSKDNTLPVLPPSAQSVPDTNLFNPFSVYFDNDEPDPKSTSTITTKDYSSIYYAFYNRKDEIARLYGLTDRDKKATSQTAPAPDWLNQFFEQDLKGGWERLRAMTELLYERLGKGDKVTITLRGYSDVGVTTTYKQNLAARRINSLQNHFMNFDGGILGKFIKSGQLTIVKQSIGGIRAQKDLLDSPTAIYEQKAMQARRVEVVVQRATRRD